MNRTIAGVVLGTSLVLGPVPVRAQQTQASSPAASSEDARTLFQQGQAAYAQGDYESAIARWTRAYELDPRPLLQFNLSQAYERLGRLEDALAALDRFIATADSDSPQLGDARARSAALRERLSRTSVRIVGAPEGATILVDGEDRGRTPRPDALPVSAGTHRLVLRAPGYADFTSTIVVSAGQSVEVPVEMRALADTATPPSRASESDDLPIVPIVLFAAGGAAVIAGGVLGGLALAQGLEAEGRDSAEADSARGLALAADITIGVGIAAAAAGLVVLLVDGSSGDEGETRVSVAPWGGPTGAGLAVGGRF